MLKKVVVERTQYAYTFGGLDRSEFSSFKKRFTELVTKQKHDQAKRILLEQTGAWANAYRYPPIVNAFQNAHLVWNRAGQNNYAATCINDCIRVLLKQRSTHRPTSQLGNAIKIIETKKPPTFKEIAVAVNKMIDADIWGRDEPFEGPHASAGAGTDAIPVESRILGSQKRKRRN